MADKDIADVDLQDTNDDVDSEEVSQDEQPEKMLPVSRVNKLVQKAKKDGERKMAEQLEQLQAQLQQQQAGGEPQAQPEPEQQPPQQQQQSPQSMGGIQQPDMQEIERRAIEAMKREMQANQEAQQKEAMQREVENVANQYYSKMAQGKELYDDFDEITAQFDPAAFPSLVYLANEADNTPAIIYELQKNPAKLTHLATLVDRSPQMARNEIGKLSQSIKANQQAQQEAKEAQEPLNRMQPSKVGTDSGDLESVRDYKNASFLKV